MAWQKCLIVRPSPTCTSKSSRVVNWSYVCTILSFMSGRSARPCLRMYCSASATFSMWSAPQDHLPNGVMKKSSKTSILKAPSTPSRFRSSQRHWTQCAMATSLSGARESSCNLVLPAKAKGTPRCRDKASSSNWTRAAWEGLRQLEAKITATLWRPRSNAAAPPSAAAAAGASAADGADEGLGGAEAGVATAPAVPAAAEMMAAKRSTSTSER
mmetsp:Transcript_16525/g.57878  ORF Transcript_16525/g.57878 Transcript_16525/m.57878 type:complete len:214 (+) Transcript_16525:108-749(+)